MTSLLEILRLEPPAAAPALIGKELISEIDGHLVRGIITETEAYTADDPASHSYRGESARNAAMFGGSGDVYVYFIYGMHFCFNLVTGKKKGGAVLIRSIEIIEGKGAAWYRRFREPMPSSPSAVRLRQLSDGPAKVAQALGIKAEHNHLNVLDSRSPIRLEKGEAKSYHVSQTARVGITKAADVQWRWVVN